MGEIVAAADLGALGAAALQALGGAALGVFAGWGARVVLGRLPRGAVRVPVGVCEAAVGAAWGLLVLRAASGHLPAWWLPVPAALAWLTAVLTATDLSHRLLPDAVTLPAYPAAAALLVAAALAGPGSALALRAAAGGAVLAAGYAAVHLAAPSQLGAGDVKLAGVTGATLAAVSWSALLLGSLIAAVITVAIIAVLALRPGSGRQAPHGPGMLAAALFIAAFPAPGTLGA